MILLKLTKTFPVRVCEWLLAGISLTWGFVVWNLPETTWDQAIYSGMARIADQHTWGALVAAIGLLRLCALIRNGGWRPSPHLRAACAFLTCFAWVQISIGIIGADIVTTGLAVYPWLLAADIYNVFRASHDARESDDRARVASKERGSRRSAYQPATN